VITGEATDVVAKLHNRMPVVLVPETYERWLDPKEQLLDLLAPSAAELIAYAVSPLVNSPANDDPRLVEPLEVAERGKNLELF
jgi:putative SOS response-associated peptidase YedK